MFVLFVVFGVLTFTGPPLPADALPDPKDIYIPVAAHLGGDVTFNIDGAVDSYCKTHKGRMVDCFNGTKMDKIAQEFQNRISGSCDQIKLKDVREEDFNHRFICENRGNASYTYYKITVAETVLEGLPKSVDDNDADSSGSSQNNTQSVKEGKSSSPLVVSLWSLRSLNVTVWSLVAAGSLVFLVFLAFLWKRYRNSVSGPKPNEEQTENGYYPVNTNQSHLPHDVENQV